MSISKAAAVALLFLAGSMPLRSVVKGHTVRSADLEVRVDAPFRYAGGQRFILGGVADAEQHLFVVPGAKGEIKELLWLQFEEYLPNVPDKYDYDADKTTTRNGLTFYVNTRRYDAPPQPDSDRQRAFALLAKAGYDVKKLSARVRLVHLRDAARRSELMIIYAVPSDETATLTEQALRRVTVSRR